MSADYLSSVSASVTDEGICTSINANSMNETYEPDSRIIELQRLLDPRIGSRQSLKVKGSGNMYQTSMWLNVWHGGSHGRELLLLPALIDSPPQFQLEKLSLAAWGLLAHC